MGRNLDSRERAEYAASILNNPLFDQVFTSAKDGITEAWQLEKCNIKREKLWQELNALSLIHRYLTGAMESEKQRQKGLQELRAPRVSVREHLQNLGVRQ